MPQVINDLRIRSSRIKQSKSICHYVDMSEPNKRIITLNYSTLGSYKPPSNRCNPGRIRNSLSVADQLPWHRLYL